jgi:hypothetical protein
MTGAVPPDDVIGLVAVTPVTVPTLHDLFALRSCGRPLIVIVLVLGT